LRLQIVQHHPEETSKGFKYGSSRDEFHVINLFLDACNGAPQESEDIVFYVVNASQALFIGLVVTLEKDLEEPLELNIPFAVNDFLRHETLQDFQDIII
jgi:hypothetical protein